MCQFDQLIDRRDSGSLKWDKYRDRDILPMWVADMDFASAAEIVDALRQRVEHGVYGYTIANREAEDAVLDYLRETHGYSAKREWLVWTHGLVPALNVLCRAFGQTGDSVLTCTPVYPPFLSAPLNQGKKLITSPLKHDGMHWTFDWEDLEAKVTPCTRAFILCNPHNPVGRVYTADELRRLAEFCQRHDLVLCSDEIHCDLILDAVRHTVTASLSAEIESRCITLMAPSKTYNLPGLGCAYAVIANPELRTAFRQAASGFVTEVNAFGYAGCIAAYRQGRRWHEALLDYLRANRDYLYEFVDKRLPGIHLHPMQATYLAWLNVENLMTGGIDNPKQFFEDAGVGLSPGRDFGDNGYLRLNFGCPRSQLREALERMERALLTHRGSAKANKS